MTNDAILFRGLSRKDRFSKKSSVVRIFVRLLVTRFFVVYQILSQTSESLSFTTLPFGSPQTGPQARSFYIRNREPAIFFREERVQRWFVLPQAAKKKHETRGWIGQQRGFKVREGSSWQRKDGRQRRIGRHFASAAFIAAPYIGTLCLGCRVARISTIIAGPIIKLEGPRSIARNCWFPYLSLQRFIASTLESRNGGSPLRPSRWRINDPAIRSLR